MSEEIIIDDVFVVMQSTIGNQMERTYEKPGQQESLDTFGENPNATMYEHYYFGDNPGAVG